MLSSGLCKWSVGRDISICRTSACPMWVPSMARAWPLTQCPSLHEPVQFACLFENYILRMPKALGVMGISQGHTHIVRQSIQFGDSQVFSDTYPIFQCLATETLAENQLSSAHSNMGAWNSKVKLTLPTALFCPDLLRLQERNGLSFLSFPVHSK